MGLKILLFGLVFSFIFSLTFLEVIKGTYYKGLAERNRIRIQEVKPVRGIIYDRNGISLVKNKPTFTLIAVPFDLREHIFLVSQIQNKLVKFYPDASDVKEILENFKSFNAYSYVPIVLKKNVSYEDGIKLLSMEGGIGEWPGVFLIAGVTREYPYRSLISHILGYTGFVTKEDIAGGANSPFYSLSDIKGREGVESAFEFKLRGIKGKKEIEVNSKGKEGKLLSYTASERGEDIFLTLNLRIQQELDKILKEKMAEFQVEKAAAIVLNPRNGEILALVSLPSYDNNLFTNNFNEEQYRKLIDDTDKPLFNRAIKGEYPPGSTFKLIVSAAGLEEKVIDENFTVKSVGGIRVGQWFFPDWLPGGHGIVNLEKALAWSVNSYFYTVGGGWGEVKGLGLLKLNEYARRFNLGQRTAVELPNEAAGFLPTEEWKLVAKKEPWYLGDTYHLSIGQGDILVTPLQVALWTCFFANGGILYRPHILKGDKNEINTIDKNFISPHNINLIRNGLRAAVLYGSARSLNNRQFSIAGKTGTAEFAKGKKPHGWFTGFAPFDEPEIVLTVLMEEGDGTKSAVPVAGGFFNWYFSEFKKLDIIK